MLVWCLVLCLFWCCFVNVLCIKYLTYLCFFKSGIICLGSLFGICCLCFVWTYSLPVLYVWNSLFGFCSMQPCDSVLFSKSLASRKHANIIPRTKNCTGWTARRSTPSTGLPKGIISVDRWKDRSFHISTSSSSNQCPCPWRQYLTRAVCLDDDAPFLCSANIRHCSANTRLGSDGS